MKITIVCDILGVGNNSASIAAMNLIRSMKKRGHEVVTVCSDMEKKGKDGYIVMPRKALSRADRELFEEAVWDSDAVHIMLPLELGREAMRFCVMHKIPVTADFDARAENLFSRAIMSGNPLAARLSGGYAYYGFYKHADAVRFPNETIRDAFEKAIGGVTEAYVIPNGVDGRFRPYEVAKPLQYRNRFVIVCPCGLTREKCPEVLIEAAALSAHERRIQLIFIGEGPLKSELRESSKKLSNAPVFSVFPRSQMPALYNYSDLLVDTAQIETDSVACMEALACGVVPVISDSPRCVSRSFALSDDNLFKNRDPRDLAAKIDCFIEHPEALEDYSERFCGVGAELSLDACMDRMEEMFCTVR